MMSLIEQLTNVDLVVNNGIVTISGEYFDYSSMKFGQLTLQYNKDFTEETNELILMLIENNQWENGLSMEFEISFPITLDDNGINKLYTVISIEGIDIYKILLAKELDSRIRKNKIYK